MDCQNSCVRPFGITAIWYLKSGLAEEQPAAQARAVPSTNMQRRTTRSSRLDGSGGDTRRSRVLTYFSAIKRRPPAAKENGLSLPPLRGRVRMGKHSYGQRP